MSLLMTPEQIKELLLYGEYTVERLRFQFMHETSRTHKFPGFEAYKKKKKKIKPPRRYRKGGSKTD